MTARKAPAGEHSENAMDAAAARLLAAVKGNRRRTEKAWRQLRGGGNLSPTGFQGRHIPAMATHFCSHGGYKRTAAMPKPFRLVPTAAKSRRAAATDMWRRKPTQRRGDNAARTG